MAAMARDAATQAMKGKVVDQLCENDLDQWIDYYNNERTHRGKVCEGRIPMQTLIDGKAIWKEKFVG